MPLDPTGCLPHQAMLPRQRVIAALPNIQKQIQGGCQNEETKKYVQMNQQIKTPEKEPNKVEINNLSDAEFKTLFIRMLKELSEDLSSMKKIQSETKDTLIEIKNNLQGNNSRVDEAENQINDLEHKEAKIKQSEQEEEQFKKTRTA